MIQDNTTKWKVRKFTDFASNQAMPVGYVHWSISPIVPAGELPLLGGTYDRSLYADLWSWANENGLVISESEWQAIASANNGNCAYCSSGDGSTTFRVPSIKCWVKGASSVDEVGSYLEAGLPNIEGSVEPSNKGFITQSGSVDSKGAMYAEEMGNRASSSGSDTTWSLHFNASLSNPIYGNSDTVQPPSIVGMWLIVAFGIAHNIGEADVANVMSAVEQVQTSVSSLEQGVGTAVDYIVESYRNGTEWYEVFKSGKVRQGGQIAQTTSNGNGIETTVTLLKKMADTTYDVKVENYRATDLSSYSTIYGGAVLRKTGQLQVRYGGVNTSQFIDGLLWTVEGQGA